MEYLRGCYRLAALALIALFCSTTPLDAQPPSREQPRFGGVLRAAMIGEPPSLDPHWSAVQITSGIMWHVFETLYTLDKDWNTIPHLAAGHTVTDGGRRYTITLRQGVPFHNGQEMTTVDVVASLNRWGRINTLGKAVWASVEAVDGKGRYEVVIRLKTPSAVLLSGLAQRTAAIYPKDIIDRTGDGQQLKQFVGTGPFRFVDHKPDRHVRLARFKEYAARSEPPNGAGGKRAPYLDELMFMPVPDVSVRLAGVESGSYHYGETIKQDQYNRLLTMRAVEARVSSPYWLSAILNHRQGLMTGKKLRQAFQAALDMEPIVAAAVGHPLFYRLDPGLSPPELVLWHSTAGAALYNQNDKDKARRLLMEAGYVGQPVRWLTTREYEFMYKAALVAKQQLEEVGFKIDLQVVDWATLAQRWSNPELFDVASANPPSLGLDPALIGLVRCTNPGWWCLEEKERLLGELARELDPRKRKAIIDRIQILLYEDVGRVKFGDVFNMSVVRKELRGDFRSSPGFFFWNAWLEKK